LLNKYIKCNVWRLAVWYDIYIYIYIYVIRRLKVNIQYNVIFTICGLYHSSVAHTSMWFTIKSKVLKTRNMSVIRYINPSVFKVTRTRLNVALYVHYLFCSIKGSRTFYFSDAQSTVSLTHCRQQCSRPILPRRQQCDPKTSLPCCYKSVPACSCLATVPGADSIFTAEYNAVYSGTNINTFRSTYCIHLQNSKSSSLLPVSVSFAWTMTVWSVCACETVFCEGFYCRKFGRIF
jgi:hypothetical protein